ATFDMRSCLVDQRRWLLIAQRYATCIGRDGFRGTAEQLVERPAHSLAPNVPKCLIYPAHCEARARAHAVASELHLVDARPDTDYIARVHSEDQLLEGRVDHVGDCARGAAVVGLA